MDRFDSEIIAFVTKWIPYGGPPPGESLAEFGLLNDQLVARVRDIHGRLCPDSLDWDGPHGQAAEALAFLDGASPCGTDVASAQSVEDTAVAALVHPTTAGASQSGWRHDALCRGMPWDFFYSPDDERGARRRERERRALIICRGCRVVAECRGYALERREAFGVWGATTAEQREQILGSAPEPDQPAAVVVADR
ncbi:WhiB family transcriptional regulator [Mycobacteroides abscessus]|uniref:WhiB family transcriptional regulator n=1 Tax=Mycobacteroides abscessus TaxID=36809 RepID=UPI00078EC0C1|nr:WhiB family transcriptional regulator [Mycobacteroides abscessus]AMU22984.1 transcriptional regulator [Mycobacteroides abscessus]